MRRAGMFNVAALLALVALSCASPGERAVLRVGTSGDYAPFSIAVRDASALEAGEGAGGYRGFDAALAERFARDEGFELKWVRFRWPELGSSMRAGRFDVAMSGITVRPERSVAGRFTVPVAETGAVLLIREAVRVRLAPAGDTSADPLAGLDDPSLRVAVNAGGHLERVTREHLPRARITAIPDNAAVRGELARGEVDAVVTDGLEAPVWLEGLDGVVALGPFTRDTKALWVAAGVPGLASRLDGWLLEAERTGQLAALRAEWFEGAAPVRSASPLAALLAACDERLALMPFVAEAKRRQGLDIVDDAQEARVLDAAVAAVARLTPDYATAPSEAAVRRFQQAQIDAAVAVQRAALQAAPESGQTAFGLDDVLRPALARIGERTARLVLVIAQPGVLARADLPGRVSAALSRHALPPEQIDALADAIAGLAPVTP